jgi:DNA-binding NarL/FixJ family response regulator
MPMTDRDGVRHATVLVVDDQPLMRDALRNLLSAEADLGVCGEADTVEGTRQLARERRPDVVVLGLELRDGDAFELLAELRSLADPPRVVTLAGNGRGDGEAERALRLGASACVSKRTYGDELLRIIRSAVAGQVVLGDALIQRLIRQRPNGTRGISQQAAR